MHHRPTTIACIHIPRFAAEAERQRRPDAAARLILIGETKIRDCTLGAETSGVNIGMKMSEAIGLCPRAVVLPPDEAFYERRFDEVTELLGEATPDVEVVKPGLAFMSLAGVQANIEELAEDLISKLHRRSAFMATAGIARNKFVARVAAATSRQGIVKVVPQGGESAFLAALPCSHLPLSEAVLWRLNLLGIETMGDVAVLPLGPFQSQFGLEGKRNWELAQGIDDEPLLPRVIEINTMRRLEMPSPVVSLESILAGLEQLTFAAYGDESRNGRWVRKAIARAVLDGGGAWDLQVPFREALADPGAAWFVIRAAVTRRPPERPVEELEIELVGLSSESGKQASMFDGRVRLQRQIMEAARHLQANGKPTFGRIVEVDSCSRIPERRTAVVDLA